MDQLAMATGNAGVAELGGRTYQLSRLTLSDLGAFQAHIRQRLDKIPSPFEQIKDELKHLSKEDRREVLKMAYENRINFRTLASPQAQEISNSTESVAYQIWLSLRRNHPDVKFEDIVSSVEQLDTAEVSRIIEAISATPGKKKDAERNGDGE